MKKPFIYALSAAVYIVLIVLIIQTGTPLLKRENILIPIGMLGLLVLSVAVMGFLFLSEPLKLFLENKKREAVHFFFKVLAIFAGFVILSGLLLIL